ncbi:hypothetical protein AMK21_31445 [Streptomyces sp. CB00316]|nr:hypothetical protein AMK21_31445 [Streptomyces sp. CB00316]
MTHSAVASSTCESAFQGRWRLMTSVLNRPIVDSMSALPSRSRCHSPMSSASGTSCVPFGIDADQPTMRRERVSTTNAT